jgi:exonuclease III
MNFSYNSTQNSPFQGYLKRNVKQSLRVLQLNIEGISKNKTEFFGKLVDNHSIDIIALQETHITDDINFATRGYYIHGCNIVAALHEKVHGLATYVKKEITDYSIEYSMNINDIQVISIKIADLTIINLYNPAAKRSSTNLRCAPHPAIYVGDFNNHHQE